MLVDLAHDRIGTLRAIGRTDDQLALRLKLGRTLDRVSLRPSCVPPGAIVCVRQMRITFGPPKGGPHIHGREGDPHIFVREPGPHIQGWDTEQWTAAIGERMESLMRDAVRPFRDVVPANARVVLFADEVELLACLARDWQNGGAHAWWWRSVLGDTVSEAIVRRAFLSSPTLVPAAMERLARAQCLTPVIRAMPEPFCEQLAAVVASIFAVREWSPPSRHAIEDRVVEAARPADARARSTVQPRITAALLHSASVDFATLLPAQRALVGLALLIARAPALARSPGAIAVLRSRDAWWSSVDVGPMVAAVRQQAQQSDVQLRSRPAEHSITPEHTEDSIRDEGPVLADAFPTLRPANPEISARGAVDSFSTERHVDPGDAPAQDIPRSSPAADAVMPTEAVDEAAPPVHVVDSEFAGIVYLVNLALHLELYGDFTQPMRPGLELPIADFLALVGECVLGEAFAADPVWGLLAELAGREPGGELDTVDQRDRLALVEEWTSQLAGCAAPVVGMERHTALPFLCARAGRLALSPTRLDATFDLAAHPLIIRVAGLDRDPGWVPSAGRILAFHYQ